MKTSPHLQVPEARRGSPRGAEHTIDVLELLAQAGKPLGVTEVANTVGISNAGAHRLLAMLESRGYAHQHPVTSKYSIGLRAFGLATLARSRQTVRAAALPAMRELNDATGETVHLALYDAGTVTYVERLESTKPVAPQGRIGAAAPAHCVSTGLAILAYQPHEEIEALTARGLERFTQRTITGHDELMTELARTRERGYAVNPGSWRLDVCGVAAPVRDYSGAIQASVGCCLPEPRFQESLDFLVARTLEAARGVSSALGYVAPGLEADRLEREETTVRQRRKA